MRGCSHSLTLTCSRTRLPAHRQGRTLQSPASYGAWAWAGHGVGPRSGAQNRGVQRRDRPPSRLVPGRSWATERDHATFPCGAALKRLSPFVEIGFSPPSNQMLRCRMCGGGGRNMTSKTCDTKKKQQPQKHKGRKKNWKKPAKKSAQKKVIIDRRLIRGCIPTIFCDPKFHPPPKWDQ